MFLKGVKQVKSTYQSATFIWSLSALSSGSAFSLLPTVYRSSLRCAASESNWYGSRPICSHISSIISSSSLLSFPREEDENKRLNSLVDSLSFADISVQKTNERVNEVSSRNVCTQRVTLVLWCWAQLRLSCRWRHLCRKLYTEFF